MMQSEPKSSPQNQNGKKLKLQIVKIQRAHMVNFGFLVLYTSYKAFVLKNHK